MAGVTRALRIVKLVLRIMREFPPTDEHKDAAITRACEVVSKHIVGVMGLTITDDGLKELRSAASELWDLYIADEQPDNGAGEQEHD